ncbi:MAG: S41 family peptidase [Candidatus Eiseniibacteriota bacterium]
MKSTIGFAAVLTLTVVPAHLVRAVPIEASDRQAVVEELAKALSEIYVFAEAGEKYAADIRTRAAAGEYASIEDDAALADRLTRDLQAVHADKHLRVVTAADPRAERFRPPPPPDPGSPAVDPRAERVARERRANFGFTRLEVLPGNVGVLELRGFVPAEIAGETGTAAMRFLANCDAIIFDLRKNGGGSPSMIQLLTSYLVPEHPQHINSFYMREGDETIQFHTLPYVPGTRLPDAEVFVLTSSITFSAAEEFTYNLQAMERATVVGDTTGGGAHPVRPAPLGAGMIAVIPFGRAVNPVTGTNWEGTGVVPHIACEADEALDVAYAEALRRLADRAPDELRKTELAWTLEEAAARRSPAALGAKAVASLTGTYGARTVKSERGRLWLQPETGPTLELLPLREDVFTLLDSQTPTRVTFVRSRGGRASEIVISGPAGEIARFPRS